MAVCSRIALVFALQFFIASVASTYYPNHKYDHESDNLYDQEAHKKEYNSINHFDLKNINPSSNLILSQIRSPLFQDIAIDSTETETRGSDRKLTDFDDYYPSSTKTSVMKSERKSYENFVTPRGKSSTKGYEVTTKKFKDTEPKPLTPSALVRGNDVAIALDDEDIDHQVEAGTTRPEHLNPLVYLDSYGRLHGEGQSPRGSTRGFGYGIAHSRTPPHHPHASGRVRMQVFRGPTRRVGHKKYAPWGYYVVQPADSYGPHRYPGPPY